MILKDVDGDSVYIFLRNNFVEIEIEHESMCAPLNKENAMKLANTIYEYYGENK